MALWPWIHFEPQVSNIYNDIYIFVYISYIQMIVTIKLICLLFQELGAIMFDTW